MSKYTAKGIWGLIMNSASEFMKNNSLRLAAALSYNTIFSLPPLLFIVVRTASFFFGEEAVTGQLDTQISGLVGREAATEIQSMMAKLHLEGPSPLATWIGIGTLIFAGTTIFVTLQESLNNVWNLQTKAKNGILKLVMDRILSFGMILSVSFLLLVSLVISALIGILTDYMQRLLPGVAVVFIYILDVVVSLGLITLLFALIFKYLPDAIIRWRDVWVGAAATAFLFLLGKYLIGWYLGQSDMTSSYGAAGSMVLLLSWVYYSSLIIFFGAEITQEYADTFGQPVMPNHNSVRIEVREVPHEETMDAQAAGRPPAQGRFRT
ncbi:YihY/virulence factor BrkB family protein [Rufibacter latericius]|uniref:YihY/virulence factor BrkB family protein n=1 Tax=Rufibacter latericius TaxID=2487040 RepID=A0A3M9MTC5_9BACT|nr:YihY/virulence factor BrkB family protein [Rufibacter latericius]RNI28772.1 YihY/virulence factor BrkB family protein [Rufibacter latericius]